MKLKEPLDFYSVTDHGFYMGMIQAYADTSTDISQNEFAKPFHNLNRLDNLTVESAGERTDIFSSVLGATIILPYPDWHPKLLWAYIKRNTQLALQSFDYQIHKSAWSDVARSANEHNDPGHFTTFIGYEFTTSTDIEGGNLHRNVIFNSSIASIRPWTRIDSINPEDLWTWQDKLRAKGVDTISIPHNSNGSNGQMFEMESFKGNALNVQYAKQRMLNEPIVEITQVKGTSETHPLLSPDDDWADFEIMNQRVGAALPSRPEGSYVREAFLNGMLIEQESGVNPYKFGVIAASDTHNAAGSFEEDNYWSKTGLMDIDPTNRGSVPLPDSDPEKPEFADGASSMWGASGLAGVWAKSNTREALFDGMKAKETFATSGPHIRVRFFGGEKLAENLEGTDDLISVAYETGVPMGGELSGLEKKAPSFYLWASKDPDTEPLQRLQIIKGWIENGERMEKVYDVACSDGGKVDEKTNRCPDNGAKVSLDTCATTREVGAKELSSTWTDPDFDVSQPAYYYVRALENPKCRWSTWDAIRAGTPLNPNMHATIQDRAWSSPIWYRPSS